MSDHPETVAEFLNDKAYKKAQAESDDFRQCLIEVQKRTQDKWIKKIIGAGLNRDKSAMRNLLARGHEVNSFISENGLLEESQIYNAEIEYGETFQRVWVSLLPEQQSYLRKSMLKTLRDDVLSVMQNQNNPVKYSLSSGYPRKTIRSMAAEGLYYYWSPTVAKKGRRLVCMVDIKNNEF